VLVLVVCERRRKVNEKTVTEALCYILPHLGCVVVSYDRGGRQEGQWKKGYLKENCGRAEYAPEAPWRTPVDARIIAETESTLWVKRLRHRLNVLDMS
jgi:hypothetical protein